IYNHIRGLNPWPVAYTTLNDAVIKVWWAEKVHGDSNQPPGTIIRYKDHDLVIATGNETAIKIIELQPAGKKKMTAEQFLRGAG
ncbi:methionyl-tRNA formyltransferase, partial [Bacillus sp. JJ1503]